MIEFPILILAHQRADCVVRIIDIAIKEGVKRIYISIDGPKNEYASLQQHLLNEHLARIQDDNCEVNIEIRRVTSNLGLVQAVLSGIDWIFENEETAIIMEEDLYPDPTFFKFCNESLNYYQNDQRVFSISGNNFLEGSTNSTSFSSYPLIWGWATWKNRWEAARPFLSGKQVLKSLDYRPTSVAGFWNAGLIRCRFGVLQSWALPFAAYSRMNAFVNVYPGVNLVKNVGFDELATHTFVDDHRKDAESMSDTNLDSVKIPSNSSIIDKELESDFYQIQLRHIFSPLIAVIEVSLSALRSAIK